MDSDLLELYNITHEDGGLVGNEKVVMDSLLDAWEAFLTLDLSDTQKREFTEGINKCEMVMGQQVLSRMFPDFWGEDD